ncbi:MAG: exo-alpha-sialidase [Clostridia bacterium]|nr:exo-alpha-sialidase [Clostridia bacterium]
MKDFNQKVVCNDGIHTPLIREKMIDIKIPDDITSKKCYTYGKIIKLEHNGENNGILIATNENSETKNWALYRSYDDGDSWEEFSSIPDSINTDCFPGYQPYMIELPTDMGDYKKGTILYSGCSYSGTKTNIVLFASRDLGVSWEGVCNIGMGGGYNQGGWTSQGVWEPFMYFDDESGKLYCYYSDEQNPEHNQRLICKYSTDVVNWSEEIDVLTLKELRPGMIAFTKMGNGKYAMVYEMVNFDPHAQVHIKFSDSLESWEPTERGKPVLNAQGGGLAGAPAIAWTPDGGECGTLMITAVYDWKTDTATQCALFVSYDYGETFMSVENPIPAMPNSSVRSGYSSGFFVDKDGYVYYVNDPEYDKGAVCEKLVFAKLSAKK